MENNREKYYYHLATTYFNGTLPLEKEKELFEFISADAANERLFRQWEKEWMFSEKKEAPVQEEWTKLQHRIRVRNAISNTFKPHYQLRRLMPFAAAILLLIISSVSVWYWASPRNPLYYSLVTARGEKSKVILTDGTSVWLNAGSRLQYAANFSASHREVILEGEAYFEVNKQKGNSPFRVKTADYDILVKGTKFNVTSYAEDPASSVTLLEGAIEVIYKEQGIPVEPGESLSFRKEDSRFLLQDVQAYQYKSWVDGRVEYNEITLNELSVRLSRKYNVTIYLDDNLEKDAVFKVSLRNEETIDQFLHALSKIIAIRFRRVGDDIYIMKQ